MTEPLKIPRAQTLRNTADLIDAGLVAPAQRIELDRVAERYAVAVTPHIAALVEPSDPRDPIARQFIPNTAELQVAPEELFDPIGDDAHSPVEGIVHRYPDRVLLKLVAVCAVYCRFCFRREAVGPGKETLSAAALDAAISYIAARPEIWEVILTGGDPLVLSPRRLHEVIGRIAAIPHVKIVRIHTRLPAVAPDRVTAELVHALKAPGKATYVVLHANHPRELTDAVAQACGEIIDAGIPMLSQSVLLRGVNDDVDVLAALMRAFVACRIKPYYVHHGDLARGTAHFRTSIAEGQALMRALQARVSGLCQPTYVLDIPGGHGKVPIGPRYLREDANDPTRINVEDHRGVSHDYPPNLES